MNNPTMFENLLLNHHVSVKCCLFRDGGQMQETTPGGDPNAMLTLPPTGLDMYNL